MMRRRWQWTYDLPKGRSAVLSRLDRRTWEIETLEPWTHPRESSGLVRIHYRSSKRAARRFIKAFGARP